MSQTAYNAEMDIAIKGQPADGDDPRNDIVSYNNPAVEIVFGLGVSKIATDDDGCEIPAATGFDFLGVAVRDMMKTDEKYPLNSAVAVMRRGRIYVVVDQAVTPDDPVFCRHTGPGTPGQFRMDADVAKADQIVNARYMTSAGPGELAVIDLNLV